ncbi:hypothetical protein GQ600_19432 [Phytophthora cactorum]|nr:hypothetical protein GQ600_19432 [Phytophthora cactorum]
MDEVKSMWSAFDSSAVVQLIIRHCPALREFRQIRGVKVYNTTIDGWGESAAAIKHKPPKCDVAVYYSCQHDERNTTSWLQVDIFPVDTVQ